MMPQSSTAHTKAQSEPKASGVARIINTPPEYIGWRTMPQGPWPHFDNAGSRSVLSPGDKDNIVTHRD